MARFELHDGPLKKFWEIELQGDTLHFTMGDIGSPGRSRSKRHRHERAAQDAYEKAVRAMIAQGYEQLLEGDDAEEAIGPTWAELTEDPTDLDALRGHMTWLLERDEPRGELLAEELLAATQPSDAARDAVAALRRDRSSEWIGAVGAFPGEATYGWGIGYLDQAALRGQTTDVPEAAVELLRHEGFSLLRQLDLRMPSAVKVVMASSLPALRELHVHTCVLEHGVHESADLDLDRLTVKTPKLRRLRVRGPYAVMGSDALTGLHHLDVGESAGWLEGVVRARPQLQSLHLDGATADGVLEIRQQGLLEPVTRLGLRPAWDADLSAILRVLEGLTLDRLTLHGVHLTADLAATLAGFGNVAKLDIEGLLTPEAAEQLAERGLGGAHAVAPLDTTEPSRDEALAVRSYARGDGSPRWSIAIDGRHHFVNADGGWTWARFPTADAARQAARRRIEARLREGYRAVDDAS